MRDPYEVLGLKRSATEAEVKKAYRKLAKLNHPDRFNGDAAAQKRAQAKLSEINSAYEILGEKPKREKFDSGEIDADGKPRFQGFEGFRGGAGRAGGAGAGPGGFENIDPSAFAEIFAGMSQGRGGGRSFRFATGGGPGAAEGAGGGNADFLGSIFGGLGGGMGGGLGGASGAMGNRGRPQPAPGADVRADIAVTLEDLDAGRKPAVTLPNGRTLAVTLPRGVADGQTIRLAGQGQPSPTGGPPGDLLVTVRFVPHPQFKVEGSDLRIDLPVSLDEAVLGAKVPAPTLSGKVQVTLPPRSGTGRALRLKGKGLPNAAGGNGDLFVTPRIVLPAAPDPDLEALMQRWRDEARPGPRQD